MRIGRSLFVVSLTWVLVISAAAAEGKSSIPRGSSLSVERDSDVLISPAKTFTCGFQAVGTNAYILAIWFTADPTKKDVWSANRDRPVNGRQSRLSLRRDGRMELVNAGGEVVWQTETTGGWSLDLLDSGNLVVKGAAGEELWQSFHFPTHTLLPGQPLTKTTKLVASLSVKSPFSGYYFFFFDNDNVLRLMYDTPEISSIYWPTPSLGVFQNGRNPYNASRIAVLDETGRFTSSDRFSFIPSDDVGRNTSRRLTLDPDGNLRQYRLSGGSWLVSWEAMPQLCNVHGQCGQNGICAYMPSAKCFCLPGHVMRQPGDWKQGCRRAVNISCDKPESLKFVEIPFTDFYGFDLASYSTNISYEQCRKKCVDDCNCNAFGFRLTGPGFCFPKGVLFNGFTSPNFEGSIFLKLPFDQNPGEGFVSDEAGTACNSTRDDVRPSPLRLETYARKGSVNWVYAYGFVSALALIEILFIAAGWWFLFRRDPMRRSRKEGYKLLTSQFRKFTYSELKKATDNFKHELGRGGAGAVYRGVLSDNRVAAVKKLDSVRQGAEEFQSEMSLMGRIYHMNLVRVWGFCAEGSHRLLVSELQERGSLDRILFSVEGDSAAEPLDWEKRFKIALGTARGLAYLHDECLEWIVHCDVKPENILLDADFEPKIADFGLAKLLQRGSSDGHVSRVRGTKGYMAPEWVLNLPLTSKVDVYSYGVVLLELVTGRRVSYALVDGEDGETELSRTLRKIKAAATYDQVLGLVDPRLGVKYDKRQAKMVLVLAASCMEVDRSKRPSMAYVAETLLSGHGQQKNKQRRFVSWRREKVQDGLTVD